jgi:hypothetical protein
MDVELFKASPAPSKRGQRRRGGGGGGASAPTWDRAALAAAALSGSMPKPGTICYECGSKQTPQWREGPAGELAAGALDTGGRWKHAIGWAAAEPRVTTALRSCISEATNLSTKH